MVVAHEVSASTKTMPGDLSTIRRERKNTGVSSSISFLLGSRKLIMSIVEEKFGQQPSEEESSSDEEDDDGDLGDPELDEQFLATLKALRNNDPRIRDKGHRFFSDVVADNGDTKPTAKKEKPMTLKDYHRRNLLEGHREADDDDTPRTYAQEQEDLKNSLVKQMHEAAEEEDPNNDDADDDDDFLVRKEKLQNFKKSDKAAGKKSELDVAIADKNPDLFLSNFLASKAWEPSGNSEWQPFDSDDEDGEGVRQADEFEEAYNMRFEDPTKSKEKLMAFSRDTIAKYSVRREEATGRKKARELEKARKLEEKREREEEKARLRKLKIDDLEQKVNKIRKSAGLKGKDFDLNEWKDVVDADWDDDKWEAEMQRRFGEEYYAEEDAEFSEEEGTGGNSGKRKPKKPTWDDEIDIKDIAPDLSDDENEKFAFSLSDGDDHTQEVEMEEASSSKRNSKKARLQAKADAKKAAKRDRRLIEGLVDQSLNLNPGSLSSSKPSSQFRYRETSPSTFGLTPRDILLATDAELNQYVGLKKMAAFRDEDRKKKDKKKLGKKARLRAWRKETFGDEEEPQGGFERFVKADAEEILRSGGPENQNEGAETKKKRKRSKKATPTAS